MHQVPAARMGLPQVELPWMGLHRMFLIRVKLLRVGLLQVKLPWVELPQLKLPRVWLPRVWFPRINLLSQRYPQSKKSNRADGLGVAQCLKHTLKLNYVSSRL